MRTLWVDASHGASGDMLLAALLDAGADPTVVRAGLGRLPVGPLELAVDEVQRQGLRACRVTVRAPESTVHRGLPEIRALIEGSGLHESVRALAVDTFTRLAAAEARVHGVDPTEVHFHEVGALDAIADVVGCALALHDLRLLDAWRVVSPVAVGSGAVRAAHGRLPVPPPAVLELLVSAGAEVAAHPQRRELCTPTGAALLCALATAWGPPPAGRLTAVGVGAGQADPPEHPNVVRVVIGEQQAVPAAGSAALTPPAAAALTSAAPAAAGAEELLWQIETTVDDLDPRIWPDLLAQLRAAGAADAWCTPALMRKGRPGQVLTVLAPPALVDSLCQLVFTHTTTLGLRLSLVQRRALVRDWVQVEVAGGTVRVKRGHAAGSVVTVQPEYDDVRTVAQRAGLPIVDVMHAARRAAQDC